MELSKPFQRVLAALIFTLSSISIQAQGQIHNLFFTELSDRVLTASLDGEPNGSVVFLGPNHWEWISAIYGSHLDWYGGTTYSERPAGAVGVNQLTIGLIDGNVRFLIDSGVLGLDSEPKNPNGGPGSSFAVFKGDATVLGPTTIYFLEVPEPGTFGLLGLGMVMLVRFRLGR